MFSKDTKVTEILNQYPWLKDEIVKMNPAAKVLNTPIGAAMLKNATVQTVSEKVGMSPEALLAELQKLIEKH